MQNEIGTRNAVRRRVAEQISFWLLVVVGSLGAIIGILDTFGAPEGILPLLRVVKNPSAITLIIVSLLALAAGLERYASFEEIREIVQLGRAATQNELQEIHRVLTANVPVRAFAGREQLYKDILRALRSCQGTEIIRSTSLVGHSQEGSAEHSEYLESLARKIEESRQNTVGMLYRVVIASQPQDRFEDAVRKRYATFKARRIEDRLNIRQSKDLWGMDVLIIGNVHLFIAFPMSGRSYTLRLGIRISDADLVEKVTRWYDECVWLTATPVSAP